jgi:hypothetical protein
MLWGNLITWMKHRFFIVNHSSHLIRIWIFGYRKVSLEVFAVDPPISRYNFLPELANNFISMFCCLYWHQMKIFWQKTLIFDILHHNQSYSIALIHFTSVSVKYWDAISLFNLITIFSTNHMSLLKVMHLVTTLTCLEKDLSSYIEYPVRIRVRIDPPHPHVCRKRRLNGAVLRMRPEKPRSRVTAGVAW